MALICMSEGICGSVDLLTEALEQAQFSAVWVLISKSSHNQEEEIQLLYDVLICPHTL